ncbi:MAG: non-heme ferritin [Epsilonproteobacteria bacterium]|nr:MAG: non-heme ferritin [Campylobacterota bacterium]
MLKKEVLDRLNEQINLEHFSANLYLSMASWASAQGLAGTAKFLKEHSNEEMEHMHKLFDYVNETGAQAVVGALKTPPNEFKDIKDVITQTYKHEKFITSKINSLVDLTLTQKDFATFNFLQWYVAEQHEEEALFSGLIDKIEIIGTDGRGLHLIDKELGTTIAVG